MRNFTLTIAIILSQMLVVSQCPQGDVTIFSSQAQIDDFQTNYPNCTEIEGGVIISGGNIVNLYGLSVVTSIGGDLSFLYNVALNNMIGMEGLTSIGGSLLIIENYTLTSLMGLNNVTSIGGDLVIQQNNFLSSLNGLDNIASIGGGLFIGYSATLTIIAGLNNLNSIGNMLEIIHNPTLTDITGLENLASIGGYLWIQYNDTLTGLTGLEDLTSIGGELSVRSNYALTSLTGLNNIDAGSISDLMIYSNTSLGTCEVWSICNYLGSPNGSTLISNNATGCNTQQQVEDACDIVSVNEFFPNNKLTIYPNPTSSSLTIELPIIPSHNTYITISNTSGQQLIQHQITEPQTKVDISQLPKGVYFVKVWNDQLVMIGKVIKE